METDQTPNITMADSSDPIVESDVPFVIEETQAPEHVNVGAYFGSSMYLAGASMIKRCPNV
jgi:hypothetical protein